MSAFCRSMLSRKVVLAAFGLESGLDDEEAPRLSFSRASSSDWVKVSVRLGRKGTGVLDREVRNYVVGKKRDQHTPQRFALVQEKVCRRFLFSINGCG
jgi:hypothetical protein